MTWLNVIYHIECESLTVSIGASNCINRNNSHGGTNNLIRVKGADAVSLGVQGAAVWGGEVKLVSLGAKSPNIRHGACWTCFLLRAKPDTWLF